MRSPARAIAAGLCALLLALQPVTRLRASGMSASGGAGQGTAGGPAGSAGGPAAGTHEFPAGVRTLVATGHRGEVLALEYDEWRGLLFSAGEDGTVRVWDTAHRTLTHRIQVTHFSAALLAVNPSMAPHVAVLETDAARSWAISVWDWEKERRLFRIELSEEPLFLRYSGGGNLLAWGESRWEGLKIVNAVTGAPVPTGREGFGIVSFAEIGASEKTILTYQPAGRIEYWDLASGSVVRELSTVAYLSAPRISRDKRFLLGSTGREAVLVDLLTGAVRSRIPVSGVLSADISVSGSVLALTAGSGPAPGLSLWSLTGEAAERNVGGPVLPGAVIACFGAQGVFAAARGGEIVAVTEADQAAPLARDELAVVTGIDVLAGRVALVTSQRVWVFSSRLLAGSRAVAPAGQAAGSSAVGDPSPGASGLIEAFSVPNPHAAACGVSFVSADRLLVWKRGGEPAGTLVLDIPGRAFLASVVGTRGPLLDSEVQPAGSPLAGQLLSVEQGGTLWLSDPLTGESRWESRQPGAYTAAALGVSELAAGRNAAIASGGSLLRINRETGETVTIPTRAVFTYELAVDQAGGALYSIGVDGTGATSLFRHTGRGFEAETAIDRVDWEDLFAALAFDPITGLLFSSLGSARIGVWDSGSLALMRFPDTGRVPRNLRARDGLLFALNRDSTVGVWDERGASLAEISVFNDGEWTFLLPDGRYAASALGVRHLSVTVDGSPVPDTEAFRVR